MSLVVCFLWGYLLYTGSIDSLWRMMGIANQLLATIALVVGTTYLLARARKRIYALTTAIPLALVVVTVFTAGVERIGNLVECRRRRPAVPDAAGSAALVKTPELLSALLAAIMLLLSALVVLGPCGDGARRSAVSVQRSADSGQRSAANDQPSAVSGEQVIEG